MRASRMLLARALLFATLSGGAEADESPLPDAAAALSGSFTWAQQPAISWEVKARSSAASTHARGAFSLSSDGLKAEGIVSYEPPTKTVGWKFDRATVDLAVWARALATRAAPSAKIGDFSAKGLLAISSHGQLRNGLPSGSATLALEGAKLDSRANALRIDGISFDLKIDDLDQLTSAPAQTLAFAEAEFSGVRAKAGTVRFQLRSLQEIRIEGAEMKMFDGTVVVDPFTVPIVDGAIGAFNANVRVSGVALGEIALLLPETLAEARGRLSGEIILRWTPKAGLNLGDGSFHIDRIESVEVRLAPQPGFLTSQMPAKITLLPAWLGKMSRWLAPDNPAYPVLRAIEMGDLALTVDALEIHSQPSGDVFGRTARVVMTAHPKTGGVVESVLFEVNVSGPLDQVIKFGLSNPFSFKTTP